jgi:hypothetical protein
VKAVEPSAMALSGNLRDFSIPDVFRLVSLSGKSGVLHLSRDEAEGSVWFRDGEVFFAQSDRRRSLLGARLVAAGRVSAQALARAVEERTKEPEGGRRIGEILIDDRAITHEVLESFVQEQIQDTIFDLFLWEDGAFEFEVPAIPPQDQDIGLAVSVENLVMEGARRLAEWTQLRTSASSGSVVFRVGSASGQDVVDISLKPSEWRIVTLTDGTRTVRDVAAAAGVSEFDAARVLYGLLGAGLLQIVEPGELMSAAVQRIAEAVPTPEPEPVPASEPTPELVLAPTPEVLLAPEPEVESAEAPAQADAAARDEEPALPLKPEVLLAPEPEAESAEAPAQADAAARDEEPALPLKPEVVLAPEPEVESAEAPPHADAAARDEEPVLFRYSGVVLAPEPEADFAEQARDEEPVLSFYSGVVLAPEPEEDFAEAPAEAQAAAGDESSEPPVGGPVYEYRPADGPGGPYVPLSQQNQEPVERGVWAGIGSEVAALTGASEHRSRYSGTMASRRATEPLAPRTIQRDQTITRAELMQIHAGIKEL